MKRCAYCRRRIWFWQNIGWYTRWSETGDDRRVWWHGKCWQNADAYPSEIVEDIMDRDRFQARPVKIPRRVDWYRVGGLLAMLASTVLVGLGIYALLVYVLTFAQNRG